MSCSQPWVDFHGQPLLSEIFFSTFRKREGKDKPVLYRGQLSLSLDRARRGILYKYLVVKKGKSHWEDLSDFVTLFGIVNRALKIPERYIKPGGKWAMKLLKVFRFIRRDLFCCAVLMIESTSLSNLGCDVRVCKGEVPLIDLICRYKLFRWWQPSLL